MNALEIAAHDLHRLRLFLAHFVDHMDAHLAEIHERSEEALPGGPLRDLLEAAITDMAISRRSMARVVEHLDQETVTSLGTGGDHHAHHGDHEHAHSHPHSHDEHHHL